MKTILFGEFTVKSAIENDNSFSFEYHLLGKNNSNVGFVIISTDRHEYGRISDFYLNSELETRTKADGIFRMLTHTPKVIYLYQSKINTIINS